MLKRNQVNISHANELSQTNSSNQPNSQFDRKNNQMQTQKIVTQHKGTYAKLKPPSKIQGTSLDNPLPSQKDASILAYTSSPPSMNQIVYTSNKSLRIRSGPKKAKITNWITFGRKR
jgi:hypothetical protein